MSRLAYVCCSCVHVRGYASLNLYAVWPPGAHEHSSWKAATFLVHFVRAQWAVSLTKPWHFSVSYIHRPVLGKIPSPRASHNLSITDVESSCAGRALATGCQRLPSILSGVHTSALHALRRLFGCNNSYLLRRSGGQFLLFFDSHLYDF